MLRKETIKISRTNHPGKEMVAPHVDDDPVPLSDQTDYGHSRQLCHPKDTISLKTILTLASLLKHLRK
ncbi:MAG: hypothetical protein PHI28_18820 [Mangrovibacterium sp.]|nr:hypothetical protein [Mangrovibacterium sp.]